MAKFLSTTGLSYHLEQIIRDCTGKLILISPYLQINDKIKELLTDLDRMKNDIRIVFREEKLNPQEKKWMSGLSSIRASSCKNLHAKCYMNESNALITSMNLYEYSQVHNNEMGIFVEKATDPQLYSEIENEANMIVRSSDPIHFREDDRSFSGKVEISQPQFNGKKISQRNKEQKPSNTIDDDEAYCIRCGDTIEFNVDAPYCKKCYSAWKKTANENKKEKYCHNCGDKEPTMLVKPMCFECYKVNREHFKK